MSSPLKFAALLVALATISAPALARDGGRQGDGSDRGHHGQDRRHDDRRNHGNDRRHDRHHRRVIVPGWKRPAYRTRHDYVPTRRVYHHPPTRSVYRRSSPRRVYYRPQTRVGYYHAPGPRWVRGARYYGPGYGRTYIVRDYGYYGLRPPPHGHYWRP